MPVRLVCWCREHPDWHPRNVEVGPVARSRDAQCGQLAGHSPNRTPERPIKAANTVGNNKSHDLLLLGDPIGNLSELPRMSHYEPARKARAEQHSDSSGGNYAGTGSGQDGFGMGTVAWTKVTHLALTSSQPGHTGVSPYSPVRKRHDGPTKNRQTHPSRRSFGTARRIRTFARKPLGLNPWVREELS